MTFSRLKKKWKSKYFKTWQKSVIRVHYKISLYTRAYLRMYRSCTDTVGKTILLHIFTLQRIYIVYNAIQKILIQVSISSF